jgi:hypothetical protein
MDLATAPRGELVDLIYNQERKIELLEEAIIELQEKLKQKEGGDDSPKNYPHLLKPMLKRKKVKMVKENKESMDFPGS